MVTETFSASAGVSCLEQLSDTTTASMETYGCGSAAVLLLLVLLLQLKVVVSGRELHVGCCSDGDG